MNLPAVFSVALLLLSSEICKGEHVAQVDTNGTKRTWTTEICDCHDKNLNYETTPLHTYLYKYPFKCIPPGWEDFFALQEVKTIISKLSNEVLSVAKQIRIINGQQYKTIIEPPMRDLFQAFRKVPAGAVKVVIVGQDPTPTKGRATGMAFSVEKPVSVTVNIFKELENECYHVDHSNGDLSTWAAQGVLLLNRALTITQVQYSGWPAGQVVVPSESDRHQQIWKDFTEQLVRYLDQRQKVWILWGQKAKELLTNKFIQNGRDYTTTGVHPSGKNKVFLKDFFKVQYFKCANKWLKKLNKPQINWNLALKEEKTNLCKW